MGKYTLREMMTIVAAREIKNGDIVFCGTGISMLAAMAAKNINAPDSVMFFETGAIDSKLDEIPLAVADSRVMYWAATNGGLFDAFTTMQNPITGQHVIGILGAAQIDLYGNLNTTVIGDYVKPKARFSGSGGGCDVASFVPRCIIFMQQEKKRFVRKLDYLTSPGHMDGPDGRAKAGLREGGPTVVITNMAVFRFDGPTKRMYLSGSYPGITTQQILENMEFAVDVSRATEVMPPTPEELKILREKCDPQRLIL
ncbi:MAG: ketoacid-CoA transferase [Deltaproteobacteria bacterium]|nr:ketoacid-CoA transferase [Deltaproteobacteria bacterium]